MLKLIMTWLTAGYLWILMLAYFRHAYGERNTEDLLFVAGGIPVLAYSVYAAIDATTRWRELLGIAGRTPEE